MLGSVFSLYISKATVACHCVCVNPVLKCRLCVSQWDSPIQQLPSVAVWLSDGTLSLRVCVCERVCTYMSVWVYESVCVHAHA